MIEPERSPARSRTAWPFITGLVALVAILAGSLLFVFYGVSRIPGAVVREGGRALGRLERVAEAFRTGSVTTTFLSYATEVEGVSRLQFATVRQTELFERKDEASILWGTLDLPVLVVEARAPVETTYYLDLEGRWEFRQEGDRIEVTAPPIRFNTPAVDASRIEYRVRAGSLLRDEELALRRLQAGITEMARRRAAQNLPLVREQGRRQTELFIRRWLVGQFEDGADYDVLVRFAGEAPDGNEVRPPAPVLQLDDG